MKTESEKKASTTKHREKYAAFVNDRTITYVVDAVGADRLKKSTDSHINDIPLPEWDRMHGALPIHGKPRTWSLSDTVCTAKEAARQWLESQCETSSVETSVFGVKGTLDRVTNRNGLYVTQVYVSGPRAVEGYGSKAVMRVSLRFDDRFGNGHQTFSITADITTTDKRRRDDFIAFGCLHDDIAAVFPEFTPLIRWHGTSTDGPTHYVENTLYLAGDRDAWGRRAGEPSRFEYGVRFDGVPVTHRIRKGFAEWLEGRLSENSSNHAFSLQSVHHSRKPAEFNPHYTPASESRETGAVVPYTDNWGACPFRDSTEAAEFVEALNKCAVSIVRVPVEWSKGKERELDAARNAANWPDATDAQLCAEPDDLKKMLLHRLDSLQNEFRDAMSAAGFERREKSE